MRPRVGDLVLLLILAAPLAAGAAPPWPPLLPPRESIPAPLAPDIERVWARPTIKRQVEGERAQAPLDVYVALIDAPEIATAAARHLQLARYDVRRLGPDRFQVDDGSGARGEYQVLVRERGRRVMFSRGHHTGRLVGTITGIALTEVRFEAQERHVAQRLTAWVVIDNRLVAMAARVLVPLFGQVADRKLGEALRVTARVAEWAASRPTEFCEWLDRQPLAPEVRDPVRATARSCRKPPASRP